ncbi:hypothetical protein D3C80_2015860 [compost metagenome]
MSSLTTICRRNTAVPQAPAKGPMGWPSSAWLKASGRLGAAPRRKRLWSPSTSSTEQSADGSRVSLIRQIALRISRSGWSVEIMLRMSR